MYLLAVILLRVLALVYFDDPYDCVLEQRNPPQLILHSLQERTEPTALPHKADCICKKLLQMFIRDRQHKDASRLDKLVTEADSVAGTELDNLTSVAE